MVRCLGLSGTVLSRTAPTGPARLTGQTAQGQTIQLPRTIDPPEAFYIPARAKKHLHPLLESATLLIAYFSIWNGAVAQLGERFVRNEEARGSSPLSSTKKKSV